MSDKPVAERLQVKGPRTLAVTGAPSPIDGRIGATRASLARADVVVLFVRDRAELDRELAVVLEKARKDSIFWLAYPKLTSKLAGDLNRDIIHALAPDYRLDAVSQIAIDDDWSALRFKRVGGET